MKNIESLKTIELNRVPEGEKNRELAEIYNGARRNIIEIILRNGETLPKHKAFEPITVLCVAGNGKFLAGKNLEEEQKLTAGTFLTLRAEVEHAVVAEPEVCILVTKFKNE